MSDWRQLRTAGRALTGTLAIAATLMLVLSPVLASAATARASLTDIENDVMCVACHESLAVAQSPQADSERTFIRRLISQGLPKKQIEQALVGQYGTAVLALPPAHGFNLVVYVIPPALLLLGIGTLVVVLPRWRRRTRAAAGQPQAPGPALDPGDVRRLDEDLARRI
jgi:cytochrome c-type biogenesis protein CcmH/NrfF